MGGPTGVTEVAPGMVGTGNWFVEREFVGCGHMPLAQAAVDGIQAAEGITPDPTFGFDHSTFGELGKPLEYNGFTPTWPL